jgi:hypothetical protein
MFMNGMEVDEAQRSYRQHPVLGPATRTLAELVAWTDRNSDGWAYWRKPKDAAAKLVALIGGEEHPEGRRGAYFDREREDATEAKLGAALRPIKSFRTRMTREKMLNKPAGEVPDFPILATLEEVAALDAKQEDTRRRAHIALAQQIANEYGVTVAPEVAA